VLARRYRITHIGTLSTIDLDSGVPGNRLRGDRQGGGKGACRDFSALPPNPAVLELATEVFKTWLHRKQRQTRDYALLMLI